MAASPTSESELQLYRVLQRANLLQYFDTFISQGGDDVQQLCEAGEEEFLEIMALVGMASKPLHVRRLQKALQEWVTNPTVFHQPLGTHTSPPPIAPGSILASVQRPYLKMEPNTMTTSITQLSTSSGWTCRGKVTDNQMPTLTRTSSPGSTVCADGVLTESLLGANCSMISNGSQQILCPVDSPPSATNSYLADDNSAICSQHTALTEGQLKAIEKAAAELAKTLPQYEPKPLNMKKLVNKEIEVVMKLPEDHPERTDLLRKYAAIYGRFDSHRKNEKTLSLHEISVNEAAAQLCRYHVALLTRRNDLFPLARQVVRDSGYQYSKGHSRGQPIEIRTHKNERNRDDGMIGNIKTEPDQEQHLREVRMSAINHELSEITVQQQSLKDMLHQSDPSGQHLNMLKSQLEVLTARQLRLLSEQSELLHKQRTRIRSEINSALNEEDNQDEEEIDEDSIPFPSDSQEVYSPDTPDGRKSTDPSVTDPQYNNNDQSTGERKADRSLIKQEPTDDYIQTDSKTNNYGS